MYNSMHAEQKHSPGKYFIVAKKSHVLLQQRHLVVM